jgi:hypothetical protein
MDVGMVNGRYFANNSALGLEPSVTLIQQNMTWAKGIFRYLLAAMTGIMRSLQHMGEEVFKSRLEKAIAKELPIDFHDVWTVAMHELQQRLREGGEMSANIDLQQLVRSIKRKHPNLFYSLKDLEIDEQDMKEAGF